VIGRIRMMSNAAKRKALGVLVEWWCCGVMVLLVKEPVDCLGGAECMDGIFA